MDFIDFTTLGNDLKSLRDEEVRSVYIYFRFEKFKTRELPFDLSLLVLTRFNEFDFSISCNCSVGLPRALLLKDEKISNVATKGWEEKIPYDLQLNDYQLYEAKKNLGEDIILLIKHYSQFQF